MDPLAIIRLIAKEFASVSNDTINQFISLAGPLVNSKRFGSSYNQAVALITCHMMKMNGFGDTSSGDISQGVTIQSYREGETQINYNTTQKDNMSLDGSLALTSYGTQFLAIRNSKIVGISGGNML